MTTGIEHDERLERRTRQIGRELFARARGLAPSVLNPHWWDEHVMQWSMNAGDLKGRLFRLVDVLPGLPDRAAVLEHLREYLGDGADRNGPHAYGVAAERLAATPKACAPPRQAPSNSSRKFDLLRLVPPLLGSAGSVRGRLSAAAFLRAVRRLARRFIAGATPDQAVATILRLRARRQGFTLDLLGEKVLSETEADDYAQRYCDLIASLTTAAGDWPGDDLIDRADSPAGGPAGSRSRELPRVNLSLKLSSLDSQFDPLAGRRSADAVLGRLRPILRLARGRGAFLHVDMEDHAARGLVFDIFERAAGDDEFADWRDLGVVVQAYLRDGEADLDRMIALARRRGTPLTIRLVKGAYWDYENVVAAQRGWPTPVFSRKCETDAAFERLTRRLLEAADRLDPAFASHNVRSLAHAMAAAERLGLPDGRAEFQLLFGMGDPIKAALVERGRRVRIYAPFGDPVPGMAYLIRRLLENTANESFLRQGFVEHAEADRLLADPAANAAPPEPAANGASFPEPAAEAAGRVAQSKTAPRASARAFTNTPDSDFSREDARMAITEAVERMRSELGRAYRPVIGGERAEGEEVLERESPADPACTVGRIHMAGLADADRAVAAAREASADWAARPVAERAELLDRLADLIEAHRHDLAAVEVFECAKPIREADADVSEAVDYCRFYAAEAERRMAESQRRDVPGERNDTRYLPRGAGVVIAPWNFPLAILCGMSTAAAAAGNAVVLKPAEQSSTVAARFFELIEAAGFPPGVFNFLPGRGETVGARLVAHPGIDFVAFTGSWAVGKEIYRSAAAASATRGLRHVVAEMGGKNAIIVDADADLDDAVRGVVASAFGYAGQKCSACSRAIVVGGIYERFCGRLIEAARSLVVGPPDAPGTFVPPLIDRAALEKVRGYVAVGRSEARCVLETDVSALGPGCYVGPTIFADVPPTARIATEEIFGPVLAVMRAADLDEALRIANGVEYALTGGLYSRTPSHVARVRAELRVGNLYFNRKITGALVDRQPFGGFGRSGLGSKAGGPDYLLQFLLAQTLTENTLRHGFAPQADPPAGD